MADRRPALGKGLSALIPDAPAAADAAQAPREVDIDRLEPNDHQPRRAIDGARLDELARSIKANGIIQPIVVRRLDGSGSGAPRFQIIAGERRWRAAQVAGLRRVPVVVTDVAAGETRRRLEMALIENIQRENLNPIEEAQAYQRLVGEFGMRQEDVASQVGRDRSSVANTLRLLKLPDEVRAEVATGRLTMGHARALVSLPGEDAQRRVARDVLARELSVRETEAVVRDLAAAPAGGRPKPAVPVKDVHTRAAEEQLHLALGTAVEITRRGKGGVVSIRFTDENELQRIYEYLTDRR